MSGPTGTSRFGVQLNPNRFRGTRGEYGGGVARGAEQIGADVGGSDPARERPTRSRIDDRPDFETTAHRAHHCAPAPGTLPRRREWRWPSQSAPRSDLNSNTSSPVYAPAFRPAPTSRLGHRWLVGAGLLTNATTSAALKRAVVDQHVIERAAEIAPAAAPAAEPEELAAVVADRVGCGELADHPAVEVIFGPAGAVDRHREVLPRLVGERSWRHRRC